jgi:hypothetical protein
MQPCFPGMNPYLEDPELWTEVHAWLMVLLARSLNPLLTPKYRAAVEKRVYTDALLVGIPDVSVFQANAESRPSASTQVLSQPVQVNVPMREEVQESYLEIRQAGTGQVVTVIELLSPKNKRAGVGRDKYNAKRTKVLASRTHLVEIDLLRTGEAQPISVQVPSDYRILVSRAEKRPQAELYPFNLRDQIPRFRLPLLLEAEEPALDLELILNEIYQEAALEMAIDYNKQPVPPLEEAEFQWVQQRLGESGHASLGDG